MYKVTIQNTENGQEITRNYEDKFFENGEAERLGQELYEMFDQVKQNYEQ